MAIITHNRGDGGPSKVWLKCKKCGFKVKLPMDNVETMLQLKHICGGRFELMDKPKKEVVIK